MMLRRPGATATMAGSATSVSRKRAAARSFIASRAPSMTALPLADGLEAGAGCEWERPGIVICRDADTAGDRLGDLVEDLAEDRLRLRGHERDPRSATEAQLGVEGDLAHAFHCPCLGPAS